MGMMRWRKMNLLICLDMKVIEREKGKKSGKKIKNNLKGVIITMKICKVVVRVMIVVKLKGRSTQFSSYRM